MADIRTIDIGEVIAASRGAGRFEGKDHGSPVSFFYVTSEPGKGATKHRHPYVETFVIIDGDIDVTVDGVTDRMRGAPSRSSRPAPGTSSRTCRTTRP